jgi:hypothetical protein
MNGRTSRLKTVAAWAVALGLVASGLILTAAGAWALSIENATHDEMRALLRQAKQQQEAQP